VSPTPPARDPAPLDDDALPALFNRIEGCRGVLLAVSGGSDSTALLHLYARWRDIAGTAPPAMVATVDHRLRPESSAEAASVAALAATRGLAHATLPWEGDKPTGDLQPAARAARYRLLAAHARAHDLDTVVTAHTRDDQAETLLLRLAHGSGLAGLAAMRPERPLADGVRLVRPFLGIGRDRLRATLAAAGIGWSEDPSNADRRFARPRLRALAPALAAEGLDADSLATAARRLARADAAIEAASDALAAAALTRHPGGFVAIAVPPLAAAPEEVVLRLLGRAIGEIGGEPYGPRLDRLERLVAELGAAGADRFRRTLGGAVVDWRGDRLWVLRERGRTGLPALRLEPGGTLAWDGRFRATLSTAAPCAVTVAALGAGARAALGPAGAALPASALATVPAAFVDGRTVAIPAFGVFADTGWQTAVSIEAAARQ
jgi:tRNA(Ile)-lysidine synthase